MESSSVKPTLYTLNQLYISNFSVCHVGIFPHHKTLFEIVKFAKIGKMLNHEFTKIPFFIQGFPCSIEQLLYRCTIQQQFRLASESHDIKKPSQLCFLTHT